MQYKKELQALIKEKCFLRSETPIFRLTSGKMSDFYFDLRRATLSPQGQFLIGNIVFEMITELGLALDAVGGLTMGADPIATATACCSYIKGRPLEAFVIRKEPKAYGTMRQVEGNVEPGSRVVVLDDVLTTGKSTIKAIDTAREFGLEVLGALVLLDRCEHEGKKSVEAKGVKLWSVFTASDFPRD